MYIIDRQEVVPNREGKDEMFMSLTISDDIGVYSTAFWIMNSAYLAYVADPSTLDNIIAMKVALARQNKIDSLAQTAQ